MFEVLYRTNKRNASFSPNSGTPRPNAPLDVIKWGNGDRVRNYKELHLCPGPMHWLNNCGIVVALIGNSGVVTEVSF